MGTLKTQGRFASVRPVYPPSGACPRTWRPRPLGGPAHPTRTCCARARPSSPSPAPAPPPRSPHTCPAPPSIPTLPTCPLCGAVPGSFREGPLCARRCAKPELLQSSQPLRGKRLEALLPRLSGVWPFAQGPGKLEHPSQCLPFGHRATVLFPFTSTSVNNPGTS